MMFRFSITLNLNRITDTCCRIKIPNVRYFSERSLSRKDLKLLQCCNRKYATLHNIMGFLIYKTNTNDRKCSVLSCWHLRNVPYFYGTFQNQRMLRNDKIQKEMHTFPKPNEYHQYSTFLWYTVKLSRTYSKWIYKPYMKADCNKKSLPKRTGIFYVILFIFHALIYGGTDVSI